MKINTIQDARDFLFTRHATGMKLGMENMRSLMERLDHPEENLSVVHVAGTNGKGSTSAILDSIFRAAGLRSGLYTSPHLTDESERIRINGQRIDEEEIMHHLAEMMPHIEAAGASFFEILTAMALRQFKAKSTDLAVLETGLGGRLDATSVVTPLVSIITSISQDHTKTLGEALPDIAREKAGILKPGVPGVIGSVTPDVRAFYESFSARHGMPLLFTEDHIKVESLNTTDEGSFFDIRTRDHQYKGCHLRLLGRHQVLNAGAALLAVDVLREAGYAISDEAVKEGLKSVRWPARLERISRRPDVIIDSAHNPMGTASLAHAIESLLRYDKLTLLFGVLADKNYETMLGHLAPLAHRFVFTRPLSDRALSPEVLAALPQAAGKEVHCFDDIEDAWNKARAVTDPSDCLVAAGSIYFVGELLKIEGRINPEVLP